LIGLLSLLSSRSAPKPKGDPFFTKPSFIALAVLCIPTGLYLLLKTILEYIEG
jgi:hypothetical protein